MASNATTFPIREDKHERIEVHVAGFCFRQAGGRLQLLMGKRRSDRQLYPSYWECGGGQVRPGESFEEALLRQFVEEFGLQVRPLHLFSTYEIIRPRQPKIPGIKYLCWSQEDGREDIVLNEREFSECKWVSERACLSLRLIPGVRAEAKKAFAVARQLLGPQNHLPGRRPSRIGFQSTR